MSLGLLKLGIAHKSVFKDGTETPIPETVAGLFSWHDASDTASIGHTGGSVAQWNDKSSNGYHLTAAGADQPTTGTRTVNSLNVIDFNGTSNKMAWASGMHNMSAGANTLFVLFVTDSVTGDKRIVQGENEFGSTRWGVQSFNANLLARSGNAGSAAQSGLSIGTTRILGLRRTGTTVTCFFDGVEGTPNTSAGADLVLDYVGLAAGASGSNFFDGGIGEVLAYNAYLSDTDSNTIGNYLATKWNGTWTGF